MASAQEPFYVDVPYHLIQSVRLVHALMESDYCVRVHPDHSDKFSRIKEVFNVSFGIGVDGIPRLSAVGLDHSLPRTSVGGLSRPLISPRAVIERCQTLWADGRPVRFSFAGLVTESRRRLLGRWLGAAVPTHGSWRRPMFNMALS